MYLRESWAYLRRQPTCLRYAPFCGLGPGGRRLAAACRTAAALATYSCNGWNCHEARMMAEAKHHAAAAWVSMTLPAVQRRAQGGGGGRTFLGAAAGRRQLAGSI